MTGVCDGSEVVRNTTERILLLLLMGLEGVVYGLGDVKGLLGQLKVERSTCR